MLKSREKDMKSFKCILCLVFIISLYSPLSYAEESIKLGIFPYVSPQKLIKHQKGLIEHFELGLKQKISIVTAKSVRKFVERVRQYKYDIVYSAPHLARYAEKELGYYPISMTKHKIQSLFIVPKNSTYKRISDLKRKKITMGPPIAIIHQIAINKLKKIGLESVRDFTLLTTKTHENAIFSVVNGDSDAGVTGVKLWKNLAPYYKDKLRLLDESIKTTGFILLAKPNAPKVLVGKFKNLSLSFNDTPAGKKYLFQGFKEIDKNIVKELDAYTYVFK